jgi:hypothetical protein
MNFLSRLGRLVALLFALILAAAPAGKDIAVWALTESKVYHCPGSRWYKTGKGKEIRECQALKDGYKPAFGQHCGSVCPAK